MRLTEAIMTVHQCDVIDAVRIIRQMCKDLDDSNDPEEVLQEYNLEPDYVIELIGYYEEYLEEQELNQESKSASERYTDEGYF